MAKRLAALAIGVAQAKPLPYLSGAINCARWFHDWSTAMGYESQLVTDEDKPVTVSRLRDELDNLLKNKPPIERLIIYFAGHGLIREAEEGLWLLSDWRPELRAVAPDALKRRLRLFGVGQVAMIADACRSLPADVDQGDLTPDAVLGDGPVPAKDANMPALDRFIAAQDGAQTFAVPGANPDEDRCVFSGVLLEALWGLKADAFSKRAKTLVTSGSLGTFLREEVPKVAAQYGRKLDPTCNWSFAEGEDVYFGEGKRPKAPTFPPWPPKGDLIDQGSRAVRPGVAGPRPAPQSPTVDRVLERREKSQTLAGRLSSQERPRAFETESGFAIDGAPVVAVWTPPGNFAERHGQENWWRIEQRDGYRVTKPAPVLIEFATGLFAAVTALPRFIASVLVDDRGVSALVYREIYAPPDIAGGAERAIAAMEAGSLRVNEKMDLALELRQDKHADPVLGVISAYLYESVGDADSNRRMAYYYIQHDQPIPYDIAFLGELQGRNVKGVLEANVPKVPKREPKTDSERRFSWTHEATPMATGIVGGFWPWLKQGWAFLEDPSDAEWTIVHPGLPELRKHLKSSRFTTLDSDGGHQLAQLFGLERRT